MRFLVMTAAAATACGAGPETYTTSSTSAPDSTDQQAPTPRSRAAFEAALAAHDAATDPALAAELAAEVDRLAAQRYATVSRLYWHTDLDDALAEARELGRPVLSLRMLGRLDSDYSCANSRFFRVALYANAEVSALLRDTFVLHWSTEREVPVITVDYGDGRVMKRTLAGNSAHYVLDARGRPVDLLPGLYGPRAFERALRDSAEVARKVAALDRAERDAVLVAYHRRGAMGPTRPEVAALARLAGGPPNIFDAQRMATSKAMIEVPILAEIDYVRRSDRARADDEIRASIGELSGPERLDAASRALVSTLAPVDWGTSDTLAGDRLDELIAAFERQIGIDTAINEHGLRVHAHKWFADGSALDASFGELNARVYSDLFLTPASDRWLGMAAAGAFTALPSSGLSRAPRR